MTTVTTSPTIERVQPGMTDSALNLWKQLLHHPGVLEVVVKDGALTLHHVESDATDIATSVEELFSSLTAAFESQTTPVDTTPEPATSSLDMSSIRSTTPSTLDLSNAPSYVHG